MEDSSSTTDSDGSPDAMAKKAPVFTENSHVIVCYEGEYFPCLVVSKKEEKGYIHISLSLK